MKGKICINCGLMSENLKTEDEFIDAGWMWGSLNFVNGANISFSLCPECKKTKCVSFMDKGWAHRANTIEARK
jgi:hypothetical protein